MNLKRMIIQLLERVENGEYSQIILDSALKVGGYRDTEKGLATEIFYGVIRNKLFLEHSITKLTSGKVKKSFLKFNLMIAMYQIAFMESKESTVVWEATEISKKRFGAVLGKFTNGILRTFIDKKQEIINTLEKENRWGLRFSYPDWIVEKIRLQNGEDFIEVLKYYKQIPVMSYRFNLLKGDVSQFEEYIKENQFKVQKKIDNVFYIKNRKLLRCDFLQNNKILMQDASSYLAAKALEVKPGEFVLDACAAPGGKTSVLAEMMGNTGYIDACEIHEDRSIALKFNLMKNGVKNCKVHTLDAREIQNLKKVYDKILLDVPCSGIGVLRKKPEILYNRTFEDIYKLSQIQLEILESSDKVLKAGGEMVYSTCTILAEENGEVIEKFLKKHPNYSVQKLDLGVLTHRDDIGGEYISIKNEFLDGFYMIKLKKENG